MGGRTGYVQQDAVYRQMTDDQFQQKLYNTLSNPEVQRGAMLDYMADPTKYQDPGGADMARWYGAQANSYAKQQQQGAAYQNNAAHSYLDAMYGRGPSVAQLQMQRGIQQAQAAAASTAASARGGGANMAAAQRLAMTQQAGLAAQGNEQAGLLRAQEVAQARQGLGQLGTQVSALGQQGQMGFEGLADSRQRYTSDLGVAYDRARTGNLLQDRGIDAGVAVNQANIDAHSRDQAVGAGASALTGLMLMGAMSDERSKENIHDGGAAVDHALTRMKPYSFAYKGGGEQQLGVMAQDMERSGLARAAIDETPSGMKMIDGPKGMSLALAGIARLNERLEALEKGKGNAHAR